MTRFAFHKSGVLAAVALCVMEPFLMASDEVYATSFEVSDGEKGYLVGQEIVPNKSFRGWTITAGRATIVTEGEEGKLHAPHGAQMLQIGASGSSYLDRGIVPSSHAINENFRFSVLASFMSDAPEEINGSAIYFYLNNWRKESGNFAGIHFGIRRMNGILQFFYNSGKGDKVREVPMGGAAQPGTFYRFEVDFDAANRTYEVRVSNPATGEVLAKGVDGVLKSGKPLPEHGFNYFRVLAPENVAVYLDDVKVTVP